MSSSIVICKIFAQGQSQAASPINSSNLSPFDQITVHPEAILSP